eukprot:4265027-Amphidinium_carterae.1
MPLPAGSAHKLWPPKHPTTIQQTNVNCLELRRAVLVANFQLCCRLLIASGTLTWFRYTFRPAA